MQTAEGEPDTSFWQSIYKPKSAYGQDTITGWIVRLFPYLEEEGRFVRNEFVGEGWIHEPIWPWSIPRGLSSAQVRLRGEGGERLVALNSGFYGAQQLADGSLAPLIGWTVCESDLDRLFDSLARAHPLDPPAVGRSWTGPATVPALLLAFSARFGGGRLYDGELVLLPPPEPRGERPLPLARQFVPLVVSEGDEISAFANQGLHFGTLRDGRRLIWARMKPGHDLVLLVNPNDVRPPCQVVANSLLEFLQRLATEPRFPPWEIKGSWSPPA